MNKVKRMAHESKFIPGRYKKITDAQALMLAKPQGFARCILNMDLYPKQEEALNAVFLPGSVSFSSNNDGGKTRFFLCAAVLWHLTTFPKGIVAATSGSYRQLEDQLLPSLHAYKHLFPAWKWYSEPVIQTEYFGKPGVRGGFFRGFSTDQPGRAEGDHAEGDDAPLLYIVDEAKSCQNWLRGVIEGRVHPTRLILTSSHGFAEGWFYESQTIHSDRYQVIHQTADDCPHISPEHIADIKAKWPGPFGDSILGYGFMPLVEDATVHYRDVDFCMGLSPEKALHGETHAGCDFAWSNDGDESVLALRVGNLVTIEAAFRRDSLHAVCDEFISHFTRLGLKPSQISGDEGGGGSLIMDELERRGWSINRVSNGFAANDDEHYANKGSEGWMEVMKLITNHSLILPNDRDLRYQLINRKRVAGSRNRLKIESKKDMKERGVNSPDRADACVLACSPGGGEFNSGAIKWARAMPVGGFQESLVGW